MITVKKRRTASLLAPTVIGLAFAGFTAMSAASNAESLGKETDKNAAEDQRELLPIPFATRDKLLGKMNKENLGVLGRMLAALSRDDLGEVAHIANELSYSSQTERASRLRGSVTFAVMATDFHGQKMPAIRQAAEQGDRQQVLLRMSEAVQACMSCHAATRLVEWPKDRSYSMPAPVDLPDTTPTPQRQIPDYEYKPHGGSTRP